MKDENKNCPDIDNRGNVTLKNGEKVVIRLSTRNPALNIATRKHYEGNDNVKFLYQEDDTLSSSKYWEKLAERANILDVDDLHQPPATTSSLTPKLKDLNKCSSSLSEKEEASFYANIEREWKIKKERKKLRREKEADIDKRITAFQIEIQRRLAHEDKVIMSPERDPYSETMRTGTDESMMILSDMENNIVHSSHNNEMIESSGNHSSCEDLVIEDDYHYNENYRASSDNILQPMTQTERLSTFTKEDHNYTGISVESPASEVVDSEENNAIDFSVFSSQVLVQQTSHFQMQTKSGSDCDLDDTNDLKDAQDFVVEESEVQESGLHEFDDQSMDDIACTTTCPIYKDYFDERNSSDQCNDFDGNVINLLNSSDSDENEYNSTLTNEEDEYHIDEHSSSTKERIYAVANKSLSTKTYEQASTEGDTDSNENVDDLANYHDAIFEEGSKTDQTHSVSDGESITGNAIKTGDQKQYTNSMQSVLSHSDIETCTSTLNFSEFETNGERGQEDYGSDSISHQTKANDMETSDNEFHDCNTTFNVSLFKRTETPQTKTAFKEMSPLPAATPQSPRINSILDELLDASLNAYEKKSAGIESTTTDFDATDLISKTLNVVGEIDEEFLRHLTEGNEVHSQEEGRIKCHLEEGLEYITVKENFIDLHRDIPQATTIEQDMEHSALDEISNSFRYMDERSDFSLDFANEQFKKKRKLSDVSVEGSMDSFKKSNSLFKRAKCSFLNILSSVSKKDMHQMPNNEAQNLGSRNVVSDTKTLPELQDDSNETNGELKKEMLPIDSPESKNPDSFINKNTKILGNLVEAILEFTNTSLSCFEPDNDDAQKDQSLVTDERFSKKEDVVSREDNLEEQQSTLTTEGPGRDVSNAEQEKRYLKENFLDEKLEEKSNASLTIIEGDEKNISLVEDKKVENEEVENEEVENGEVENGEVENEEVGHEEVGNGEVGHEEVGNGEVGNEEVENGEVENGEVGNGEVENEEVENEEVENEENEAVKDHGKNQFLDLKSAGGAINEQRVDHGAEEEFVNGFKKEVNHFKDDGKMPNTFLGHILRNHAPFKNIASDVKEQTSSRSALNKTVFNDYEDENTCTSRTTAIMDSSDSDFSYIDAEVLQLADDDIHILPINYHHASEFSNRSQPPTPSIEVKMEATSSDQTVSFEDTTEFMKVDESFNQVNPEETDINQDVPMINVTSSNESTSVENQIEPKLLTSDGKIYERKLSAPPVAVRTRSRSPSRRSEISKTLLNTDNVSKIDLRYKANRVISYGSDEDPIELNPNLPRIYPEMVEEADNFIENDLERHGLEGTLKFASSDAEEESQQKIVVKKRVPKKMKKNMEEIKVEDTVDPRVAATFEERLRVNTPVLKVESDTGKVFKKKHYRRNAKGVRGKKRGRNTGGKSN